jgi:hypothetical protein
MHLLALELFTFDSAWSKGVERFLKNVKAKNILINQQQQHIPVHCLNSQQSTANGGFITHENPLRHLVDTILHTWTSDIFHKICIKLASKMTGVKTVKLNHKIFSKLF